MNRALAFIATLGPLGKLPAPGTMGSLAALCVGLALLAQFGVGALVAALAVVTVIGFPAAAAHSRLTGKKDASEVIIDEVIGQWLVLLVMPPFGHQWFWQSAVAAFLLFRFFDIVKPRPINMAENIPGAAGVIADDVLAGIYAGICLWAGLVIAGAGA